MVSTLTHLYIVLSLTDCFLFCYIDLLVNYQTALCFYVVFFHCFQPMGLSYALCSLTVVGTQLNTDRL